MSEVKTTGECIKLSRMPIRAAETCCTSIGLIHSVSMLGLRLQNQQQWQKKIRVGHKEVWVPEDQRAHWSPVWDSLLKQNPGSWKVSAVCL